MRIASSPLLRVFVPLVLGALACLAQSSSERLPALYVSPTGNDGSSGLTPTSAFRTLGRAQQAVQAIRASAKSDIVVWLQGGRYELSAPLVFGPRDGGLEGRYVRYVACKDQTPVISGGRRVTGWRPVPGKPYFEADVPPSAGYCSYFRQLYINGRRAYRASGPWITATGFHDDPKTPQTVDGLRFPKGTLGAYRNTTDLRLFHVTSFKVDEWPVVAVFDEGDSTVVQCAQPHFQVRVDRGEAYLSPRDQFMVVNAFEELDQPGEWYHDRTAGKLYYRPRPDEDLATADCQVPAMDSDRLVALEGASPSDPVRNLSIEGVTFEYSNWLFPRDSFLGGTQSEMLFGATGTPDSPTTYSTEVPGSIRLNHARGIRFEGNTVRHMASCGVQLFNDVSGCLINGNIFHDTTGAGVEIGHASGAYISGRIPGEAPVVDNTVSNNLIRDTGRDYMQATGISIFPSQRTKIIHNDVGDTAFMGIHSRMSVKGDFRTKNTDTSCAIGENYIAFNRVREANWAAIYGVDDNGSIYNFGPSKDTQVFRNLIEPAQTDFGVYNDDNSFRMTWRENVILARSLMSERSVDETTILYDGNFSSSPPPTAARYTGHCVFTNFTQLPDLDPATWPPVARTIAENAGLEPAYRHLLSKVPSTPDYGQFLPSGVSLATAAAKSADSGNWTALDQLWTGWLHVGGATVSGTEGWVEFIFSQPHDHLAFSVHRTNHAGLGATEWKVQLWDKKTGAWVDALPWVGATGNRRQELTLSAGLAADRIRLQLRNTAKGGRPGVYKFLCYGQPKS